MLVPTALTPQNSASETPPIAPARTVSVNLTGDLGEGITDVAGTLIENQNKRQRFDLDSAYLSQVNDDAQKFEDMQKAAPPGAPGFTQQVQDEFDTRHTALVDEYKSMGYSKDNINALELRLAAHRGGLVQAGRTFQTGAYQSTLNTAVDTAGDNGSQILSRQPEALPDLITQAKTMTDNMPDQTAEQRQAHYAALVGTYKASAAMWYGRLHPEATVAALDSGHASVESGGAATPEPTGSIYDAIALSGEKNGASKTEIPYLKRAAQIESGGRTDGPNNGSSTGLFQFHPSTFSQVNPGGDIHSVDGQVKGALALYHQNVAALNAHQIAPTDANAYILHQQGIGGGIGLLSAPPGTSAVAAVGGNAMAIAGNIGLPMRTAAQKEKALAAANAMTAQQFTQMWQNKWAGTKVPAATALAPTDGTAPAAMPTPAVQATGLPVSGKTGDPVLDELDAAQRLQALNEARSTLDRNKVNAGAALDVMDANAKAAWSTGQDYAGPMFTEADAIKAKGPIEGPQFYQSYVDAQRVGTAVKGFITSPQASIYATLQHLMPTDTTSPTYAKDMAAYNSASTAASNVMKQRYDDPAAYVMGAFPDVQQAFTAAGAKQGSYQAAYSAMNQAYNKLGIPAAQREPLPKETIQEEIKGLQTLTPEQKLAKISGWREDMGPLWGQAMTQLQKAGLSTETYLAGMINSYPGFETTAANVLRGKEIYQKDPSRSLAGSDSAKQQFQEYLGDAQTKIDPTVIGPMYNTATDLYIFHGGNPKTVDPDLFQQSIREAMGGSVDPATGPKGNAVWFGGMRGTGSDTKTILPPGTTGTQFDNWHNSLTEGQVAKLNPAPPYFANGQRVSAKQIVDEGTFVMVAPGQYQVQMHSDGKVLGTRNGQPWIASIAPSTVK